MRFKSNYNESDEIIIEDIANYINDLADIDSFFILEKGNCSYIQCINYNGSILVEERIYENNGFKHYILGHNFDNNELTIDDNYFKRFKNEIFSIEETIDIFTDYYNNIPINTKKRDITNEFPKLEKGFIFIKWMDSAVATFKESLDEFITVIEPFIVDELKKDCVGKKINPENSYFNPKDLEDEELAINCSIFKFLDIHWAVESIIEIAEKYEFLEDIILYKKISLEDKKFFKLNIEDFKK